MWVNLLLMAAGFAALIWSADRFLSGAAATATNLGVSNILIGLTVVSLGTSAPEIVVALIAALEGNAILAVGNAIGSNIANIGLVLGITAIIAPLPFSDNVLRRELPWLLGATTLAIIHAASNRARAQAVVTHRPGHTVSGLSAGFTVLSKPAGGET